jgi:lipopolysaccharide/colanic/teichoic acid biosynthesis glycosyltransferase
LLRASGLDELPQLINVLRGEMSVVGPRPCIRYEYELYEPWQRARFNAVPGLTGLWQVSGKNRTTFEEMVRLDIEYAQHRTLWMDLKIILKTLPAIWGQYCDLRDSKQEEEEAPSRALSKSLQSYHL